jgi:hypothetical protein
MGILLVIIFILLILWSIKVSKDNMKAKRKKKAVLSRQQHKDVLDSEVSDSKGYWYNKQDMEDADDIMKIRYQHHFTSINECVNDLVIEMYDCGLVKTEELFAIAYGRDALTADSMVFKTYDMLEEEENELSPVSEEAQRIIYDKWCSYVDKLMTMVEIKADQADKAAIIDEIKTYGRKNLLTLMHAPD